MLLHHSIKRQAVTHALSAPPPFACPSNLVTMTDATSTFCLKARAYSTTIYCWNLYQCQYSFSTLNTYVHTHTHTHTHMHKNTVPHTHRHTAAQPHGSGTPCLSAFAKPGHFLLSNAILRLTFPVSLTNPLATHHPTRPDSLTDFGAI